MHVVEPESESESGDYPQIYRWGIGPRYPQAVTA